MRCVFKQAKLGEVFVYVCHGALVCLDLKMDSSFIMILQPFILITFHSIVQHHKLILKLNLLCFSAAWQPSHLATILHHVVPNNTP